VLSLRVHIVKKYARFLNGIDLENVKVGDTLDLPDAVAQMLVHEGWGEFVGAKDLANGATTPNVNRKSERPD
jgi:hypothetical protein